MKIDQIAGLIAVALSHPAHWEDVADTCRIYEVLNDRLDEVNLEAFRAFGDTIDAVAHLDYTVMCNITNPEVGFGPLVHAWFSHALNQVPGYVSGCRGHTDGSESHGFVTDRRVLVGIRRLDPMDDRVRYQITLMMTNTPAPQS